MGSQSSKQGAKKANGRRSILKGGKKNERATAAVASKPTGSTPAVVAFGPAPDALSKGATSVLPLRVGEHANNGRPSWYLLPAGVSEEPGPRTDLGPLDALRGQGTAAKAASAAQASPPPPPPPPPHKYSPGFKVLPLELNQAILGHLPNILSLKRAARSCQSLYRAASSAQAILAGQVLSYVVPPAVMPSALLVLRAGKLGRSPSLAVTREFLDANLPPACTDAATASAGKTEALSIADASAVEKLHTSVDHFVTRYELIARAAVVAAGSAGGGGRILADGPWAPSSDAERCRFARAFYRFELFNVLFRNQRTAARDSDVAVVQREAFFGRYSFVELEQLVCVVHFLAHSVIAPGVRFCRKRVYSWAKVFEDMEEVEPQSLELMMYRNVSRGLVSLQKLDTQSFTYFRNTIRLPPPDAILPAQFSKYVLDTLTHCQLSDTTRETHDQAPQLHSRWRYPDPDPGPATAWQSLLPPQPASPTPRKLVSFLPIAFYRMAYVMWDADSMGPRIHEFWTRELRIFAPFHYGWDPLEPWVLDETAAADAPDPEEGRIFADGFHDDYEGPIFNRDTREPASPSSPETAWSPGLYDDFE